MREWLEEVEIVLRHSIGTQVMIVMGLVAFVGVHALGSYLIGSKTPTGQFAAMFEPVYETLGRRYDRLAWIGLASCWWAAFKFYRKTRKRLFDL